MVRELRDKLGSWRQSAEDGQVYQNTPSETTADASYLSGVQFGNAPPIRQWQQQRIAATQEEDLILDQITSGLDQVLHDRGPRPAHAPVPNTSEDMIKLISLEKELEELRRTLATEQADIDHERDKLAEREANISSMEKTLKLEKEQAQQREDELRNYPCPAFLDKPEGTINVVITGNSGVGKSSLINQLRRVRPGALTWAPVGVKETTMEPTMYIFPGKERFRLWDLPGADTENFPRETYIRDMGLRYFDSVLIVFAGRFTTMEITLKEELTKHQVPFFMVRTKIDLEVWNNQEDNKLSGEKTVQSIRDDMLKVHGVEHPYLVSARSFDKYDMPALSRDAFPGLRKVLDANAPVFEPGSGWGDSSGWAVLDQHTETISGIQGHWEDYSGGHMHGGYTYIVDGSDVHVTAPDGLAAVVKLETDAKVEDCVWWSGSGPERWYIDREAERNARSHPFQLRWSLSAVRGTPRVWVWRRVSY
jgi:small GTP-binding protein